MPPPDGSPTADRSSTGRSRLAHPGQAAHLAAMTAWARSHDVATVDPEPHVEDHVRRKRGNPDGVHWGWAGHRAVGEAVAVALGPRLR